ncbi:MAG: MaoC family dehydratase [Rhodobiaceae bacterium]|nr:MaoC family dehydratase [Rhodobiaceae bacterium]
MTRLACRRGDRLPELALDPVGQVEIEAYTRVSGDNNPLHRDPAYAVRLGIAEPPLPGLLVLAQFPRLLAAWDCPHTLRDLQAQFLRPIPVATPVQLTGRVAQVNGNGDAAILRLSARVGDRLVVAAEATIGPA